MPEAQALYSIFSEPVIGGTRHAGAFVIQFGPGTDIEAGRVVGRVEHVTSYEALHFNSLDELLSFMARVLKGGRDGREDHT
jgi:hypothetical protein